MACADRIEVILPFSGRRNDDQYDSAGSIGIKAWLEDPKKLTSKL